MFATIRKVYVNVAILSFNTVLLLVLLNGALTIVFRFWDGWHFTPWCPNFLPDHPERVATLFPGMSHAEFRALFEEYRFMYLDYAAFVEFRERAQSGRYVNVDAAGFRRVKDQAPWPPTKDNFNVFVFGGSTTFGVPFPDDQSIPSGLQECLHAENRRVAVYNFGHCFYFSSQERVLFETLLLDKFRPALAVFIDGLNECASPPDDLFYTPRIRDWVAEVNNVDAGFHIAGFTRLPMFRAATTVLVRLQMVQRRVSEAWPQPKEAAGRSPKVSEEGYYRLLMDRYLANKALIETLAKAQGVQTLFVWQPMPGHAFDLKHHPIPESDFRSVILWGEGYRIMDRHRKAGELGGNFLWLADIQPSLKIPLYVDRVHYTGAFNRILAERIAAHMIQTGLVPKN
jgi:hypothetical protein